VISDVDTLQTLPPRDLRQRLAEIIKHAVIRDPEMFEMLQRFDRADLPALIRRNVAVKGAIVAADERETTGERALLNFGHTVGHAIERATDFKIPHGDCISMGMVAACDISTKRAAFASQERDDVVSLLKQFDLPTQLPAEVDREKIAATVVHDKKFLGGKIRFVVARRIGEAHVSNDVTMEDIREAIAA